LPLWDSSAMELPSGDQPGALSSWLSLHVTRVGSSPHTKGIEVATGRHSA